jgi:small subunit ribosomal protein S16
MLKIRLQRTGRKHEPTFRLVLTDSKNSTKSGKLLEVMGSHDPRFDKNTIIKADRVKYWLGEGAQASGTVHNLLITHKVITGKKINVLPKKTVPKKEGEETPAAPAATVAPAQA